MRVLGQEVENEVTGLWSNLQLVQHVQEEWGRQQIDAMASAVQDVLNTSSEVRVSSVSILPALLNIGGPIWPDDLCRSAISGVI